MEKVIDLLAYKKATREWSAEQELFELEETVNALCEEAWQLLAPMRRLKIRQLTIDSSGSIVNIRCQDGDNE